MHFGRDVEIGFAMIGAIHLTLDTGITMVR